jgi:hypothetical protein
MEDKMPEWLDQALKDLRKEMDLTAKSMEDNLARIRREISADITTRRRQDRINILTDE